MPSPFPGMDPYLEGFGLPPDVHIEMIRNIRAALNPHVLPKYFVRIEVRTYVSDEVDLVGQTIEEAYLAIYDRKTNALVTVIEVLGPANKIRGSEGRKNYMAKRAQVLAADVHLVEIDLLRAGEPPFAHMLKPVDYRVFLSRANERDRRRCWPINLRDPLPVIAIPLKGDDPDVPLDLHELLRVVYKSGAYDNIIDYAKPCDPPLPPRDAHWADQLLRSKGLR